MKALMKTLFIVTLYLLALVLSVYGMGLIAISADRPAGLFFTFSGIALLIHFVYDKHFHI